MMPRPRPACRILGAERARPNATQPTPVAAYQVTSSKVEVAGLTAQASSWFTQRKAKIPAPAMAALVRASAAARLQQTATASAAAEAPVRKGTTSYLAPIPTNPTPKTPATPT